ncbi:hypothetical protein GOODEAATRI_012924, partial [Goodea atripinnis]
SKTRKIPYPTKNPFTWIFLLVSCPNYTYEMTVWAKGKHRSYLKEFRDYPPLRSPILPFIL